MPDQQAHTQLEYRDLDEFQTWSANPKEHDMAALQRSLRRFGFVTPVLIDSRTGMLVAGHGRLEALRHMRNGGEPAPAGIRVSGAAWQVPAIVNVHFSTLEEAEAYALADNRIQELGGWDEVALTDVLQRLGGTIDLRDIGWTAEDVALITELVGGDLDEDGDGDDVDDEDDDDDERVSPYNTEDASTVFFMLGDITGRVSLVLRDWFAEYAEACGGIEAALRELAHAVAADL